MSTNPYPFEIKKVYNFTLYPATVLPGDYSKTTVMGIIDYDTALALADIPSIHVNVYPYLPQGTPDDPTQYNYLKVKLASGIVTVLGLPWINQDTIEVVQSLTATVVIDDVGANDSNRIRQALVANGFNNISITIA